MMKVTIGLFLVSSMVYIYQECLIDKTKEVFDVEYVDLDVNVSAKINFRKTIETNLSELPMVEPHISAHPKNSSILLAAAMKVHNINRPYESCTLSSFYSDDGGRTWQETSYDYWGYDPWVNIDEDNKAIMTWLGTAGNFRNSFPLQIFSSTNSGKTWEDTPYTIKGLGHGHDGTKCILKEDAYISTIQFTGDMSGDMVIYKSFDSVYIEVIREHRSGIRFNFCEPVVLSSGELVYPYLNRTGKIWCKKYNSYTGQISDEYVISDNPKLGRGYARMAVDASDNSLYRDRLYFVRAVADGKSSLGVWLNVSKDDGLSWTKEKRIDLFENARLSKSMTPSIAVNKDGIIAVSWVDAYDSQNQKAYDVYLAVSIDGAESFQRPIRVTEIGSNPRTKRNGDVANKFLSGGHYLGITAKADGKFQLIWSDSEQEVFKLKTAEVEIFS